MFCLQLVLESYTIYLFFPFLFFIFYQLYSPYQCFTRQLSIILLVKLHFHLLFILQLNHTLSFIKGFHHYFALNSLICISSIIIFLHLNFIVQTQHILQLLSLIIVNQIQHLKYFSHFLKMFKIFIIYSLEKMLRIKYLNRCSNFYQTLTL